MESKGLSLEFQQVLAQGRNNIALFAKEVLGIEGNPGQVEFWEACQARSDNGWSPKYLTIVESAGNRAGKTLGMAVAVVHHGFYKLGLKPPQNRDDRERWLRAPYEWYHVAIQQETAELVHEEVVMILTGTHPAQKGRGCPLVQNMGVGVIDYKTKDRGEYLMLTFSPYISGSRIYFRTTQDKARALLGHDMNGISFDEAGFERYLLELYQKVFNLRRLSTGGPLIFIGTPDTDYLDYRDLWELGNPENPNRDPKFISLLLPTWLNIGYGLNQADYDDIVRQTDPYLVAQNLGGKFIEAPHAYFGTQSIDKTFTSDLPPEERPIANHRYVQGVDPGISADATWVITLDFTEHAAYRGVRVRKSIGRQTVIGVTNMTQEGALLYNEGSNCATVLDSTGMAGKMWKQEFAVIPQLREFDFAGAASKKLKLLSDLKAVLEKGWLKLPSEGQYWQELRRQLLSYRLDDTKITQDAVMALAMAVYHVVRNAGEPAKSAEFHYF